MSFMLVPNEVSSQELTVCALALSDPPPSASIILEPGFLSTPLSNLWKTWTSKNKQLKLSHARVTFSALPAATKYSLRLDVHGSAVARATMRTLPTQMPSIEERPFIVMLSSCYCQRQDAGNFGRAFAGLRDGLRPDVKILCGDQVYLDSPWSHYLFESHTPKQLEVHHYNTYKETWFQDGTQGEFRKLLCEGANFFSADDHELWNNAPNRASVVRDSWPEAGREAWRKAARTMYEAYQTEKSVSTFVVPPVSFFVLDTRWNRSNDEIQFAAEQDLNWVKTWVEGLTGPGVLVLGQPVFEHKAGFLGHFKDWKLPDYVQYGKLVRILLSAAHSLVILTGDVHFGRVSSCTLAGGSDLIEIVSSPTALVDKNAKGKWQEAPTRFPVDGLSDTVRRITRTNQGFQWNRNHFMTLEFSRFGTRTRMTVRAWPIPADASSPQGGVVETFELS